jgi:hypothetical protein
VSAGQAQSSLVRAELTYAANVNSKHQVERDLAGVGTPEYDGLTRQAFYDAEAVLVLNPVTAASVWWNRLLGGCALCLAGLIRRGFLGERMVRGLAEALA